MFIVISLFLYFILHLSVVRLSVDRVLSIYNEFANYNSILKLFRLISITIISSFLFTPYLSFIILRTIFIRTKEKIGKKKRLTRLFIEIVLDLFIPLIVFILLFITLKKLNIYLILISYSTIIFISLKETISFFFNSIDLSKKYSLSLSNNKYINYSFITIDRSLRIISRDFTLATLIYVSQNNFTVFSNNFLKIFEQTIIYCSSSYVQVLPANLYIPEYICEIFNCNFFNTNYLRIGIIPITLITLLIIEYKKFNNKYVLTDYIKYIYQTYIKKF